MCRSLKTFFSRDVILLCAAFVMLVVTLIPAMAHAESGGFKKMGLATRTPLSSGTVTYTYQGRNGDRPNELPQGFIFYTTSGSEFYIRRNTTGLAVFETHSIKVPADEEPVIVPLQAVASGDTAFAYTFEITRTTTPDTLISLPLER